MAEGKSLRGGARKGAGRKPQADKATTTIRVRPEIANELREIAKARNTTIGDVIEHLVRP